MHRIKKEAIFILDASFLLYRSYYGLKPLQTAAGVPTQATYGFCRAIKKMSDEFDPSHFIVVWDSKGKSFRNEFYADYKSTRQAPPSDLFVQKKHIIQILQSMEICQIAQEGLEADDLIGSLVHKFKDHQIILVCPDKDMYQLLSPDVLVFDPFKDRLFDQKDFEKISGFPSEKIPMFYALLGDASDNIPGVDGIGKKTAESLVTQFDSLDDLYSNIEKITKERTKKLLLEQKENAYLSLKLFTLKIIEIKLDLQALRFDKSKWEKAMPLFQQLEFTSFLKRTQAQASIFDATPPEEEIVANDADAVPKSQLKLKPWKCLIVEAKEGLADMIHAIKTAKLVGVDTETDGISAAFAQLVGMSFAVNEEEAYYIPLKHPKSEAHHQLDRAYVLQELNDILADPSIHKIMHNAKFDELVFLVHGVAVQGTTYDTLLAANLLRIEEKINLKDLSAKYLHEPMVKFKDVLGKKFKSFDQVSVADAAEYGAHDALQTLKLYKVLQPKLHAEKKLEAFFYDVEMPFYKTLLKMEYTGIGIDITKIKEIAKKVDKELPAIVAKITAATGNEHEPINLNSPRQIETLLFDTLGLPVGKKSAKGKRSTDQEVLEQLSSIHPIPALIVKHRELSKLKNTYLDPLPTFVSPLTGRIHTSYSQTMVATGRLSSSNPNLQNIPTSAGYGLAIREAFEASPGKIFLSADYAQVELRILANFSGDKNLTDAFLNGIDVHTQTAAQIFDIPLDTVTHEQRQLGKRINFSIIYGLTPYGLSQDLKISATTAKAYIEKYFQTYPKVAIWMETIVEKAKEYGYVETALGRRRYLPQIRERNKNLFEAARRMAINTPVQGTQAEIMKLAMMQIDTAFEDKGLDAKLILQIHDELLIEVRKDDLQDIQRLVQSKMEHIVDWNVPLKVTMRAGNNWGEVTK